MYISVGDFEKLLSSNPGVFHHSRTGQSLLIHWQYLKFHCLLPEQTVRPIPKPGRQQV